MKETGQVGCFLICQERQTDSYQSEEHSDCAVHLVTSSELPKPAIQPFTDSHFLQGACRNFYSLVEYVISCLLIFAELGVRVTL